MMRPPDNPTPLLKRRRFRVLFRVLFWVLFPALLVVGGGYVYWSGKSAAQAQGSGRRATLSPVGVALVRTADVPVYLTGLGGVTPTATATVRSRVDGQLMQLHFQEGQLVKQGDLLAELDPRPYQIAVMQAEGQLARDQALLGAAQLDLQRYQSLLAQDSIASQQVDTQAALVKQYEGVVQSDQGNLASARLQLSYSRVVAPVSGRTGLRQVDVGNILHSSDAAGIVVITQVQPITAIFSIPEDHIPALMKQWQAGRKLPTEAWDREQKNRLASGTLLSIDNQVDATTGTVRLKAQFANTDLALFPNQFVNIRLLLDTRRAVTVIPSAAILRGTNGLFAYVVKADHSVTVRYLKTGPGAGDVTVIEEGVAAGETVVVDGIDRLREGARVEPVMRAGESAAGSAPHQGKPPAQRQRMMPQNADHADNIGSAAR